MLTGHLVPVSRVDREQHESDKWHAAYDALKDAHDIQSRVLERAQITAEVTDKVTKAVHSLLGRD
jgi:hypothetical protein